MVWYSVQYILKNRCRSFILIYNQYSNPLNNILSTFLHLHWRFPCHKYIAVTYINTRNGDGNSLYAPKYSFWTKLLRKISSYWCNFTVLSSFFNVKTQRPKTDRKKCYKCNASIEFFLDVKVCFSPVTWKLMIKLHSLRSIR